MMLRFSPRLNHSLAPRLVLLWLLSAVMTGCGSDAPSNDEIFDDPSSGTQFDSVSGEVKLSKLRSTTVCYTTDGSKPKNSKGKCGDGSTQEYKDSILLECGAEEVSASASRTVRLAFVWRSNFDTSMEYRKAKFYLDCTENAVDTDGDGVYDFEDNCPLDSNPDQADADEGTNNEDGVGDVCDFDLDNDGVEDDDDNCPNTPNSNQANNDDDELGDACDDDLDGDGEPNDDDNCPAAPNEDQADGDGDGLGDECDSLFDSDGDGVADDSDNCPDLANAGQVDVDEDGIGDDCDPEILKATDEFLNLFVAYIDRLMEVMLCANNGCNFPTGVFNYSLDDNTGLVSGTANWKLALPLPLTMTLSADDAELNIPGVDQCTANGEASGSFEVELVPELRATGDLSTENTQTIDFSCSELSGTVDMNVQLDSSQQQPITGGYYDVLCNQPRCDDNTVRFVISTDRSGNIVYSRDD